MKLENLSWLELKEKISYWLENENENFYELSFEKQKALVDAKVDMLMNELEASTPELDLNLTEDEE